METLEQVSRIKTKINPFRPGSGLFPACLAGRSLDTELFSNKLYSTITGTPKNLLIYGDKQMGKTSLLMQMERIAEEKKALTVSIISSPMDIKDFVMNLVIRLFSAVKYQEVPANGDLEEFVRDFQNASHDSIHATEIAFTDFIVHAWAYMKEYVPAIVFTVDDLDHIRDSEQALIILQNITKKIYRDDCPIVFVITASAAFYEGIQKKNNDLIHYFEPVKVGRLQQSSCINAVRVPLWEMDMAFDEAVIKEIARRSDGFPFYVQQIAHHVFEEAVAEVDTLALRRGYERAMQALEREIFIPLAASITPTEAQLYLVIFKNAGISFTDLLKHVRMPRGSVASSLKRLKEKQLIRQEKKMYSVQDRLFGAYLEKRV